MSDENQTTVQAPATIPTPAAPAPAAAARPVQRQGKKRGPEIRIPQSAFKARLEREAAAIVKRKLGISLEEAEQLVKSGGQAAAAPATANASAGQVADNVVEKYQAELKRAQAQVAAAKKSALDWQNKHKKDVARLRDRQTETELKYMALQAGVQGEANARYAVAQYAEAVVKDPTLAPEKFFATLKTALPVIFTAPAAPEVPPPPVEVPATTAPPETLQPGEAKPIPTAAGAAPEQINAEQMTPQQFANHVRGYGYVPGM